MRSERRIAFTSGISTLVTRMPRTLRPLACVAACLMLSISSSPNLPISVPFFRSCSTREQRCQLSHGLLFLGRQILPARLGIDHQQIERSVPVLVENRLPACPHVSPYRF